MKRKIVLFVLASMFAVSASAQLKATTKRECTRRCIDADATNPRKVVFEEKLRQIREKIKSETDSAKLQELKKEEEREIENQQDYLEKICTSICRGNPED